MKWEKSIRNEINDIEMCQYAHAGEGVVPEVDCSLGTSPVGAPPQVLKKWREGFASDPSAYCNDFSAATAALKGFWGELFEDDEIIYGPGSVSILFSLAFVTGCKGASVKGIAPQFPDVPYYFRFNGTPVNNLALQAPGYELSVNDLIADTGEETTLVYLDQPHNPTGQYLPIEEVMVLAEHCEKEGILLVVDEAYGGFMPEKESSVNLRFENLVTVRSFSKSWGMAGLRAGYAVVRSSSLRESYRKACPPFPFSVSLNELIPAALADKNYPFQLRKMVEELKNRTVEIVSSSKGFSIAKTSMSVPIMLVSYDREDLDLFEHLLEAGIKTEPGYGFMGLGKNSVRLRVPAPEKMDLFEKCWKESVEKL